MKVLYVVATAGRTGVETVVLSLARNTALQGAQVAVVCFTDGPLVAALRDAGITCDVVPVRGKLDLFAIPRLRAYIKRGGFDVVHTHGARGMFMGNTAAWLARSPIIITTFHEFSQPPLITSRLHTLYVRIENFLARACTTHTITCSDAVRQDVIEKRGLPPEKVTRIYNALNPNLFAAPVDSERSTQLRRTLGLTDDDLMIGAVGRLNPVKGQDHLIRAAPAILETVPQAKIIFAGSGPFLDDLQALARRLGVEKHIIFAGDVADIHLFYHALDVLAHPSLSETFGLVVLEAMACGVPVVAAAGGALPELLAFGPNSIAVPPGDSAALASGIIQALRGPRSSPDTEALETLRNTFDPAHIAGQHMALYQRLSRKIGE